MHKEGMNLFLIGDARGYKKVNMADFQGAEALDA